MFGYHRQLRNEIERLRNECDDRMRWIEARLHMLKVDHDLLCMQMIDMQQKLDRLEQAKKEEEFNEAWTQLIEKSC